MKRFEESIPLGQIQKVIKSRNLQYKAPKKTKPSGKSGKRPRIQKLDQRELAPFILIHADSVELRFGDGSRRYIFTNMDHVTRTVWVLAALTKHAKYAATLFSSTYSIHPSVMYYHSDNGSDHQGALDETLPQEVTHFVSRPRTPTDNARLERMHRTLQEDCFPSLTVPPSIPEMQEVLNEWMHTYNTIRPHQALGNLTPNEYALSLAPL